MGERMVSRDDAKMIAETCGDLADKALHWKERALAAEEGLRKFASEIYQPRGEDARLREALTNLLDFIGDKDMRVYATDLVVREARAALQRDDAHTSQESGRHD